MSDNSISVLLVGQNVQRCPELHWWLDNRELRSEYAEFYHDAWSRMSRRQFDLVIIIVSISSPIELRFHCLTCWPDLRLRSSFPEPLRPISCGCACSTAGDGASVPRLFGRATSTVHSTRHCMPSGIHAI
jgi:hypothetical protein